MTCQLQIYHTASIVARVNKDRVPQCAARLKSKNLLLLHYCEVTSSGWLGYINTRTMKLAQCISQCIFLQNDITFMQETHITGYETITFHDTELKGWQFVNSGMKMKSRAGVGLALSPNVKIVDINNILEG